MFDVICIGNATIDVFAQIESKLKNGLLCFKPDSKQEVKKVIFCTGGAATNTSVSFARFGLKAAVLFAYGNDSNGKILINSMKKENVDVSLAIEMEKYKTAYSVVLTGFGAPRVILTYAGATKHLSELHKIDWKHLLETKWIHISSFHSRPELLELIFKKAFDKNIGVSWNPGKKELSMGLAALKHLLLCTNVLFLNADEAEMLTGVKKPEKNLEILSDFVPVVVITLGDKGAIATDGSSIYSEKARKVKVVDSTGAGDAFCAGFVSALLAGKTITDAMLLGNENSASVLGYLGAKNNLLKRRLV